MPINLARDFCMPINLARLQGLRAPEKALILRAQILQGSGHRTLTPILVGGFRASSRAWPHVLLPAPQLRGIHGDKERLVPPQN